MLTNSLKISSTTKKKFFDRISFQNVQKIWQKYWRADLRNLSEPLTCPVSISVLRQGFLGIEVTLLFAVYTFRKKSPLMLIFFFQSVPNFTYILGMQQKNGENIFWFWNNCIWIGGVRHSLLLRENTCLRVSICLQTVSRFQILLK